MAYKPYTYGHGIYESPSYSGLQASDTMLPNVYEIPGEWFKGITYIFVKYLLVSRIMFD